MSCSRTQHSVEPTTPRYRVKQSAGHYAPTKKLLSVPTNVLPFSMVKKLGVPERFLDLKMNQQKLPSMQSVKNGEK